MLHNGTEFAGRKTNSYAMRKIICILFAIMLVMSISVASTCDSHTYRIYHGCGAEIAYTIHDNRIHHGCGTEIAYTIRDNKIYHGCGAEIAYTIHDNRIYHGCGAEIAYTIRK